MDARAVFRRTLTNAIGSLAFVIVGALLVAYLAPKSPVVAKVGLWIYASLIAVATLHILISVVLPAVAGVLVFVRQPSSRVEIGWLWLGTCIRIGEVALGIIGIGFAAASVGYLVAS